MSLAESHDLPPNWVWTNLENIADVIMGSSPPSSAYNKEKVGLPFYQGKTDFGPLSPIPRIWCSTPYKIAVPSDVLMSVRAPVGPTNLCKERSSIGRGLSAIRPKDGIPFLFLLFYFRLIENDIARMGTGSTFTAIKRSNLDTLPFPLAPLNEQKRIVAKIDALLAENKTARDALGKIPILLRKFRQSILTRAFNGQLTQRATDDSDSGKLLLERIRKLKQGNNSNIYKNFVNPVEQLYKIPLNWTWASTDDICWKITDGEHNKPPTVPVGIPLLSAKNIRAGYLDFNDVDFVSENVAEKCLKRCNPEPGDILIVCVGATIGRASTVTAPKRFCLQRTVGLLKLVQEEIMTDYLYYFLKSASCQNQINSFIRATAITHFNINKMKKISIPIPPLKEQKIIVEKINDLFNLAEIIQKETKIATEKINKIDQAIFAKAFRGELVPQDPHDEPASALLQRIKDETD